MLLARCCWTCCVAPIIAEVGALLRLLLLKLLSPLLLAGPAVPAAAVGAGAPSAAARAAAPSVEVGAAAPSAAAAAPAAAAAALRSAGRGARGRAAPPGLRPGRRLRRSRSARRRLCARPRARRSPVRPPVGTRCDRWRQSDAQEARGRQGWPASRERACSDRFRRQKGRLAGLHMRRAAGDGVGGRDGPVRRKRADTAALASGCTGLPARSFTTTVPLFTMTVL